MEIWPGTLTALAGFHYLVGTAAGVCIAAAMACKLGDQRTATTALLAPLPATALGCGLLGLYLLARAAPGLPPTMPAPALLALPLFVLATAGLFQAVLAGRRSGAGAPRALSLALVGGATGLVASSSVAAGRSPGDVVVVAGLFISASLAGGGAAVRLASLQTDPPCAQLRRALDRLELAMIGLQTGLLIVWLRRGPYEASPTLALGAVGCGLIAPILARGPDRSIPLAVVRSVAVLVGGLALRQILLEGIGDIG